MGKVSWKNYRKSKSAVQKELESLSTTIYSSLRLLIENDEFILRGPFHLVDPDTSDEIDSYEIEIEFPQDYPKSIPTVREIGGRIPWERDRHIEGNGTACLFVPDERYKYFPLGASVLSFLEGPVFQFFLSQTYYDLKGKWLFDQRSHGAKGILEFYSGLLQTTNQDITLKFVEYLSKNEVKGHWPCYCTSGVKLKKCDITFLLKMRYLIPSSVAKESYRKLLLYIQDAKVS